MHFIAQRRPPCCRYLHSPTHCPTVILTCIALPHLKDVSHYSAGMSAPHATHTQTMHTITLNHSPPQAYFVLDEFLLGGMVQETSKKQVNKAIASADMLQEVSVHVCVGEIGVCDACVVFVMSSVC